MDLHVVCCTLVLLTCTGVCFGQELILPERINGAVGENVVITPISIPESPYSYIRWSFNKETTILSGPPDSITIQPQYTNRVHMNTNTLALELRTPTESDTGLYTLNLESASGRIFTNETSLQVLDKGADGGGGGSLSAGAIAGIVIGVLLGIAGIAVLIFYFVKDKKMPKITSGGNKQKGATPNERQHEMHYAEINHLQSNLGQQGAPAMPRAQASHVSQHNKIATFNPAAQTVYADVRNI